MLVLIHLFHYPHPLQSKCLNCHYMASTCVQMHIKDASHGDVTFDKYCYMEVDLTTKEAGSCSQNNYVYRRLN